MPEATAGPPRPGAPWSWLADARGIGWPLVVLLAVLVGFDVVVAFGQLGTTVEDSLDPRAGLAVDVLAVVAFVSALLVARRGWLGSARAGRHPSVMLGTLLGAALLAMPIAAAAGPRLAASVLRAFGPGPTAPAVTAAPILLGEVAGRAVFLFAGTAVLLVLLGALNEHRDALAALRDARVTLEATLAASTADLASERARLRERVRTLVEVELGPRLEGPDADVGPGLRRLADTVVRPLSHEFARVAPGFGPVPRPPAVQETWRRAIRGLTVEPRLRPVILALTLTILGVARSFSGPPPGIEAIGAGTSEPAPGPDLTVVVEWDSLLVSLALLVTTFVAASVGARMLDRRLAERPAATRSGRWARALGGLGLLGVVVVGLGRGLHGALGLVVPDLGTLPPVGGLVLVANVLPLWLVTLAVSLAAGARRALTRHRVELAEHNADLGITVVRTNALLAKERKDFARALHGSVQAAVQAAGIRLDRAARDGALDEGTVAAVTEPIRAALEALDPARERPVPDLAAELERTRATWLGVCEVSVELDPEAAARLGADTLACSVALEVVREACANAVVHGASTRVTVTIVPEGEREVLLRVVDDGTSTHPLRATGLGSEVLDTSTTRWHLERRAGGVELEAVLPLG